jgi:ferredoxin
MARRRIIEIDETKCDGCGQCVPACAEGALRIVDGKAKLVADVYCDGLGTCLGECPRGAITITEREADPFDEAAARRAATPVSGGCPGAAVRSLRLSVLPSFHKRSPETASGPDTSALSHWPVQLALVPPNAPFLHRANLFLVADCVPFACADFHSLILQQRPVVIGCPKLDNAGAYVDKLAKMLVQSAVQSLTVVHMEVPCCAQLMRIAAESIRLAGQTVPLTEVTVSIDGRIHQS